ncbi:hypothetical protein JMUB6875_32750 [Nocardia sp. JMUB6875]
MASTNSAARVSIRGVRALTARAEMVGDGLAEPGVLGRIRAEHMGDHPLRGGAQCPLPQADSGGLGRGDAEHGVATLADAGIGQDRAREFLARHEPAVHAGRGGEAMDRAVLADPGVERVRITKVVVVERDTAHGVNVAAALTRGPDHSRNGLSVSLVGPAPVL